METKAITVYYNSACPICDAGICEQRQQLQGANIEWVDIHRQPERALEVGTGVEEVRERLHVRATDGTLHIGAPALAALWQQTPGRRWLAWLTLGLRWLTDPLYNAVARLLYRWNRRRGHW